MSTKYQAVRKVCILLRMCLNETNTFQVLTQTFPKMRFKQNPINLEQFNRKTHQFWGLHTFFHNLFIIKCNVFVFCFVLRREGYLSSYLQVGYTPKQWTHPLNMGRCKRKKSRTQPSLFMVCIYIYMYMLAYSTKGAWNKSLEYII